ncbi:MAG: hypothetical protein ABI882_23825 [Acidobacteriota bacterium]
MRRLAIIILSLGVLVGAVSAQKKLKPWTEWSEKDALKLLEDSAWAHTQIETDTSEMFFSPTSQAGAGASSSRSRQGATNQATNVNFHVRLLSAKPVRQAVARSIGAKQPGMADALKTFVDRDFSEFIVVAVTYDSTDQRYSGPAMQLFNSANTGVLKNNTYLEVKGGARNFLGQYIAPQADGLGAKFIFPRVVDEKPFVTPESGELRFYSEFSANIKLNMRFKLSEMTYDGKLEY